MGICYVGNFVGIVLICFLFIKSGVNHEAMNQYLASVVSNKLNFDYLELLLKESYVISLFVQQHL